MCDVRKHPARGRSDLGAMLSIAAAGERCEMTHKQREEGYADVAEGEAAQRRARPSKGRERDGR
jgi:hypothetical protein